MSGAGLFARWIALPRGDRWRLLGLMAGLPLIAALLRLIGVVRTRRLLEWCSRAAGSRTPAAAELLKAGRLAALAEIAGRRGPATVTCLRQALLVYWRLRRRGFSPQLKIGVRKQEQAFDAHAWVELEGVALNQPDLAHVPFVEKAGGW